MLWCTKLVLPVVVVNSQADTASTCEWSRLKNPTDNLPIKIEGFYTPTPPPIKRKVQKGFPFLTGKISIVAITFCNLFRHNEFTVKNIGKKLINFFNKSGISMLISLWQIPVKSSLKLKVWPVYQLTRHSEGSGVEIDISQTSLKLLIIF